MFAVTVDILCLKPPLIFEKTCRELVVQFDKWECSHQLAICILGSFSRWFQLYLPNHLHTEQFHHQLPPPTQSSSIISYHPPHRTVPSSAITLHTEQFHHQLPSPTQSNSIISFNPFTLGSSFISTSNIISTISTLSSSVISYHPFSLSSSLNDNSNIISCHPPHRAFPSSASILSH